MDDVWQAQREAATKLAGLWQEMVEQSMRGASDTFDAGNRSVDALTRQAQEYAAVLAQPMRDVVEGQRDFAEQVGRWAEMQRELAEELAAWSARQREYLDALDSLLPRRPGT
ncbi:hypothetical protein [Pseudonocardia sp.]|uniref:hypothetical protein n=1 Tax=Pseudonocardia sp. TaxID=60912 RepID=UPI003D0C0E34